MQDVHLDPEEEQRGCALVTSASTTVLAPLRLRERLAGLQAQHRRSRLRRLGVRALVFAGGLAAAAVILAMGSAATPSLGEAEAVAATVRPMRRVGNTVQAAGVRLPASVQGWAAQSRGRGVAGERAVEVVSYRTAGGADVRYAVVGGDPLDVPAGRRVRQAATVYVVTRLNGRTAVTWRQQGRTCVLTVARGSVPEAALLAAAQQRALA